MHKRSDNQSIHKFAVLCANRIRGGLPTSAIGQGIGRNFLRLARRRIVSLVRSVDGIDEGSDLERLPLTAIFIRPVGDTCNLACSYCYQESKRSHERSGKMTVEQLRRVLTETRRTARLPVSIAWHGGEPLLAGKAFFRTAIEMVSELFPEEDVTNSVQTSGWLLDREWLELFKRGGFSVGISVDGPCDLHDQSRKDKLGRGTFHQVMKNAELARSMNIPLNAICVVTNGHAGRAAEVFETIISNRLTHCNIQPNFASGFPPVFVQPKVFSDFAIDFWAAWKEAKDFIPQVLLFDHFFQVFLGGETSDCVFSGRCNQLVSISDDLTASPCSRPFSTSENSLGSLSQSSLEEVLSSEHSKSFRRADEAAQRRNSERCDHFLFCSHGCPQHRVDGFGQQSAAGDNVFCGCSNASGRGYNDIWAKLLEDTLCEMNSSMD